MAQSTPPAESRPPPNPSAKPAWWPWIIFAGIVIAGVVVAAAVLLTRDGNEDIATPARVEPAPGPTPQASAEQTATCQAWRTTKPALEAIPPLPVGWNWNTPNIDVYIADRNAALDRELDLFETKIAADDPPDVVDAAQTYVSDRRDAMQKMVDRTFTAADSVPGTISLARLNEVCGVSG